MVSLLLNLVMGGQVFSLFSPLLTDFIKKSDEDFSNLDSLFELSRIIGEKVLLGRQRDIFQNERGERKSEDRIEKKSENVIIDKIEADPIQTLYNLAKKKRKSFKKFYQLRERINARDR